MTHALLIRTRILKELGNSYIAETHLGSDLLCYSRSELSRFLLIFKCGMHSKDIARYLSSIKLLRTDIRSRIKLGAPIILSALLMGAAE